MKAFKDGMAMKYAWQMIGWPRIHMVVQLKVQGEDQTAKEKGIWNEQTV